MRFQKKRNLSVVQLCQELVLLLERKQHIILWIQQLTSELDNSKEQLTLVFCCDIVQSLIKVLQFWTYDPDIFGCTLILFQHLFLIREVAGAYLKNIEDVFVCLQLFLNQKLDSRQWERILDVMVFFTCDESNDSIPSMVLQSETFVLSFLQTFQSNRDDMRPNTFLKFYVTMARLFEEENISRSILSASFDSLNYGLSLFKNDKVFIPCALALKRWIEKALHQISTQQLSLFLEELLIVPIIFLCHQTKNFSAFSLLTVLCKTRTGRQRLKDDKMFWQAIELGVTNITDISLQIESCMAVGHFAARESCSELFDLIPKIIDAFLSKPQQEVGELQTWILSCITREMSSETFQSRQLHKKFLPVIENYVSHCGQNLSGNHVGVLNIFNYLFLCYEDRCQQKEGDAYMKQFEKWIHLLMHHSERPKVRKTASKIFHRYYFHTQPQASEWFGMRSRTRIPLPF